MSGISPFPFPEIHSFPPFFTQQPNEDTWKEQRRLWCDLILAYYRHHRLCQLSLAEAVTESPFNNRQIHRALRTDTLREVVDELVKQGFCNTVLTLYELANGDDTVGQEFYNLDPATLRRSLEVLQSQGRAQLFVGSSDDDTGVKIFP
ncbi:hypothetical protein EV181_001613 [Coemansia sp. RSA 532]|nr:hypothetical protein EV181_001613 [Coemansia sp. RSA 532]